VIFAVLVVSLALVAEAAASSPVFLSDRVIVEWDPGAGSTERRAARAEADVEYARDLGNRRFQLDDDRTRWRFRAHE
jgi:hypothetical protein